MRFWQGDFVGAQRLIRDYASKLMTMGSRMIPYTDDASLTWQTEVYWMLAFCALSLGQYEEARRLAEQSRTLSEQVGAPLQVAYASRPLVRALIAIGDLAPAEHYLLAALQICRLWHDQLGATEIPLILSSLCIARGEYDRARAHARQSMALARETGYHTPLVESLRALAAIELEIGNATEAKRLFQESMEQNERVGSIRASDDAYAIVGLGQTMLALGDPIAAHSYFRQALNLRGCTAAGIAGALAGIAQVLAAQGDRERATEFCAALLDQPATPSYSPQNGQPIRPRLAALFNGLEGQLPAEVFAAAVARGRTRSVDEIVAELSEER
jgi:tetratricopeptide (TPR) repeat protein